MPEQPTQTSNAADFADYAAAMSADMAELARRHGLQTLAYLLDIARLEAENIANHSAPEPN